MYKQTYELLTASGTNPQKTFTVLNGHGELKKDYDAQIKGNVFLLENHKLILPPMQNQNSESSKLSNNSSSLNIVHRYLVLQVLINSGDSFQLELHVKDKTNTRRRLMFTDGAKDIVSNSMHARIPNSLIKRNQWLNLCIDISSFVSECFSKTQSASSSVTNTPSTSSQQFSYKNLEQVHIEGTFKLRKIFSSRAAIPVEFSDNGESMSEVTEIEAIPKNLDFNASVPSYNQLVSSERVTSYLQSQIGGSIEESMVITGLQLKQQTSTQMKNKKGKVMNDKRQIGIGDKKSSQENQASNTDTAFRPNKFGVSNKTMDNFSQQKSVNASQSTNSNTVYSIRTTGSKKQVQKQHSGIQSSQSPFRKNVAQNKGSYNQSEEDDPGTIYQSKNGSSAHQKNISVPPPQHRGLNNSQQRKVSPRDSSVQKLTKQTVNSTRNNKQFNLVNMNTGGKGNGVSPKNKQGSGQQQQATINGFSELHQITIMEENEGVLPSERQSKHGQLQQTQSFQYKSLKEQIEEKKEAINQIEARYERYGANANNQKGNRIRSQNAREINNEGGKSTSKPQTLLSTQQPTIDDSMGIVGSSLTKSKQQRNVNNNKKPSTKQAQPPTKSNNTQTQQQAAKRVSQSNVNSAIKNKQHRLRNDLKQDTNNRGAGVRKFSTGGADDPESEEFKNKTMRFTNNNFVGNARKETVEGWNNPNTNDRNNSSENEDEKLYESIEEEIHCSQNDSPPIDTKRKAKASMPPLPPKQPSVTASKNNLKVDTMTNFNNGKLDTNRDEVVVNGEEQIEEDINPANDDADLYQIPISGGIPIKIALDNARRPFTPPFSQLVKIQQNPSKLATFRAEELKQSIAIEEDQTENDHSPFRPTNLADSLEQNQIQKNVRQKQVVFDAKLNCYYDPQTDQTQPHFMKMESGKSSQQGLKPLNSKDMRAQSLRFVHSVRQTMQANRFYSTRTMAAKAPQPHLNEMFQLAEPFIAEFHPHYIVETPKRAADTLVRLRSKASAMSQSLAKDELADKIESQAHNILKNFKSVQSRLGSFRKLFILPTLLIGTAAYGYYKSYKLVAPQVTEIPQVQEKPIAKKETMKQQIVKSVQNQLVEVVPGKELRREGLTFLEKMFKDKMVHDACLYTLKNSCKDKRVVDVSKVYGVNLIEKTVQTNDVKQACKDLVVETFTKDQRVIKQSGQLLKQIVLHDKTKDIMKEFMTQVFLREDVLGLIVQQVSNGAYEMVQTQEFRSKFQDSVVELLTREDIQQKLKSVLLFKPITNLFTLGIYGLIVGDDESNIATSSATVQTI